MKTGHNSIVWIISVLLALTLVTGLAGCSNTTQAKVLDEFIKHMAARDAAAAYALFSTLAKQEVTVEALEGAAQGQFGDMVQGYKSLTVSNIEVNGAADGAYADLSGSVNYEDGTSRNFTARMDKEGDAWLVTSVNIE
jgi:hypothetical protein